MAKRPRDVCNMRESEPRWEARQTDAFIGHDSPWMIEKLKAVPAVRAAFQMRESSNG